MFLLKTTGVDTNRTGHIGQMMVGAALSKTYSKMSKRSDKRKQRYADHIRDQ